MSALPPIHTLPHIGCSALFKIATTDPQPGEAFGVSKNNRVIAHAMLAAAIDKVFADTAPQEAMFTCYSRPDGGPIPRLTKATEGHIDLVCHYIAFDIDLNEMFGVKGKLAHTKLSPEQEAIRDQKVEAALAVLAQHDASPLCYYRSKNGYRFVHLFHVSVTPAGWELAMPRIAAYYAEAGIIVDDNCKDWTRCFKVPRCTLESGEVTSTAPWFEIQWFKDNVTLVTAEEITAEPRKRAEPMLVVNGERKELSHAREQVKQGGKLTTDGLAASHHLQGDPMLHDICFKGSGFPAEEGSRHRTLTEVIGKLTKKCTGQTWATAGFLFGLVADAVFLLGDDEDWPGKAWEMIGSFLAADEAELAEHNAKVKEEVENKAALPAPEPLQVFADGARQWLPEATGLSKEDVVDLDNEDVVQLVKDHRLSIAAQQDGGSVYILGRNGLYTPQPVSREMVGVVLREQGMEWLVPTTYEKRDGNKSTLVERTWQTYLRESTRTFATTRMLCVHRGNYLTKDEADNTQFVISPFWLRDLPPEFNEQVERWLHLLAPDGQVTELILALAYQLAFKHGPTSGLGLIGPRSVGKKLIATGLAECVNTLQCCPGKALVSRFNGGLIKSPFVWFDEGIPKGKDGIDFADTFRNLVTGGKLYIEQKGKEIVETAGVHRVIITANNYDAIEQLGEGRGRTGDDLDAISERLALFQLQKRAADYLASIDTRGWIAGDNGEPSRFVIAKHLLWHYFNTVQWKDGAPVRLGRRLLYEGRQDSAVRSTIDTAPETTIVCSAVLRAIQLAHESVRFHEGRLWIEPVGIMSFLAGPRDRLPIDEQRKLQGALRALTTKVKREFTGTDKGGSERPLKCARWFLWQDVSRLEDSAGPLPAEAKALLGASEGVQ